MSHIAGLRPSRALVPAVAIAVTIMSGVIVEPALAQDAAVFAEVDRTMENYRLDAHIPGMVWGIVQDGRLVHVKGAGVQDIDTKRPVNADTLFRIASMTKAFTALSILKLRDEGKLALDAPVETYVPELRGWKYPTDDSPKIRVRELLTHTAGFVTDDPWGDRQTPLPEERLHASAARRRAIHAAAGDGDGVLEPRLRTARPHRRQRVRAALQGLRPGIAVHAAGHGRHRVRRGCRSAGTSRPWLPLGRQRLEARADDGARRLRRDGRHPDERHRLRQVGCVSALGVAASRRRRHRTGATLERARAGAGGELPLGSAATGIEWSRGVP